ncbi:glucose 1-dehydrogenase [Paenibacillus sp. tmac-D7]|uniref:glucose 1-dehydrogenase n=1 Tax=Paenibacillus sp. tmac-D7 TaxID=2591462 RepID=UPI001141EAEB|nr:glucose 1-dehydrogenase [Paenibacillus sp. tmac-D7]
MKAVRLSGLSAAAGAQTETPKLELCEVERPSRKTAAEVLVRVLCVGLDGTDRELVSEKYGVPPEGEHSLIIGHESLGVVEEAGEDSGFTAGELVCALVRRPCTDPGCVNCRNGKQDFCETGEYVERGIKGAHGYLSEYYVEDARYLVRVPAGLLRYGMLTEPQSIVEKVWDEVQRIQQRLVWQPTTAVVLGSGPLGLLAALTCRCLGLDTLVWSKSAPDSPGADIVRACGAEFQQAVERRAEAAGAGAAAGTARSTDAAAATGTVAGAGEGTGAGDGARAASSPLSELLQAKGKRADLIVECTGFSPLAFDAMTALGPNGVLALLGVTPGSRHIRVASDAINQELVLENKCVFGSVNASRQDFETGLYRLQQIEERFPGVLDRLMTERLTLERVPELDFGKIAIKAVVDVIPREQWSGLVQEQGAGIANSFSV